MSDQDPAGLPAGTDTAAPSAEPAPTPSTEPSAKGLDAYLSDAISQHFESDTPKPDSDEPAARTRDERGRFVPKTPTEEPSLGKEIEPKVDANAAETGAKPETPAATQAVDAPRNFTAEQKAEFAKLPPEAQTLLSGIEKAREAEYTRRSQEHTEYRRVADPILAKVQPHAQYLSQLSAQTGAAPADLIGELITAERVLRTGSPQQKAEALAGIIADYGIDLSALTGKAQDAPDPVVSQLRQTVQTLQQKLDQIESQTQAQQEQSANSQIQDFADAKDETGQPKHPHFDVVKVAMGHLLSSGQARTMEEAYAIAAKPIEERIAAALNAKAEDADKARRAAVEKAANAKTPRATGSVPGGQLGGKKGLDAHLSDAISRYYG